MTGFSFTVAMLVHGLLLLLRRGHARGAAREAAGRVDARRFGQWGAHAEQFQASACAAGCVPGDRRWPSWAAAVPGVQYAVLAHAVGIDASLVQALFTQGLYLWRSRWARWCRDRWA